MDWLFDFQNKIYVKIDSSWFDFTNFKDHPGGNQILKSYHCKDATHAFNEIKGYYNGYVVSKLEEYIITNIFLMTYLNLMK